MAPTVQGPGNAGHSLAERDASVGDPGFDTSWADKGGHPPDRSAPGPDLVHPDTVGTGTDILDRFLAISTRHDLAGAFLREMAAKGLGFLRNRLEDLNAEARKIRASIKILEDLETVAGDGLVEETSTLVDAIKTSCRSMLSNITRQKVVARLCRFGQKDVKPSTVGAVLGKLRDDGFLIEVQAGAGRRPATYKLA